MKEKKKVMVVVGGESSRHVDGCGAAPDIGVLLIGHFPTDLSFVHEGVVGEEARRRVQDESREADDGVTFEEAVPRVFLKSETEIALETAGLPICYLSNFSITDNSFSGFHTGHSFQPLS